MLCKQYTMEKAMTCEGRVSDVGALIKQWSVGAVLLVIMAITG